MFPYIISRHHKSIKKEDAHWGNARNVVHKKQARGEDTKRRELDEVSERRGKMRPVTEITRNDLLDTGLLLRLMNAMMDKVFRPVWTVEKPNYVSCSCIISRQSHGTK
jgi:hypothetical protein